MGLEGTLEEISSLLWSCGVLHALGCTATKSVETEMEARPSDSTFSSQPQFTLELIIVSFLWERRTNNGEEGVGSQKPGLRTESWLMLPFVRQ